MPDREPGALWEEALEGPDTDRLADAVAALAVNWAGGDPERLKDAERILARSRYLAGSRPAQAETHDYLVTWEFDADEARSPREAAELARDAQTAPETWAVVFSITDKKTGETVRVDLLDDEEES